MSFSSLEYRRDVEVVTVGWRQPLEWLVYVAGICWVLNGVLGFIFDKFSVYIAWGFGVLTVLIGAIGVMLYQRLELNHSNGQIKIRSIHTYYKPLVFHATQIRAVAVDGLSVGTIGLVLQFSEGLPNLKVRPNSMFDTLSKAKPLAKVVSFIREHHPETTFSADADT
jgi:hypothetical protein